MKNSSSVKRVGRFILSGFLAAFAEFSSFFICAQILLMPLPVAQSISFMFGLTTSYLLNKFWVFRSTGKMRDELPRYAVLAIINLLLSNIFILWLHGLALDALVAKLLVMASVALWNFLIFQRVIFGTTSSQKDE